MTVEFDPAAVDELNAAVAHYNEQRPGLGHEFADEVERSLRTIANHPEAWGWLSQPDDLRRYRTRRFPYGLVYQVGAGRILVLAVMHLHRKPGYWRDRL